MIANGRNSLCVEAKLYYYDFLYGESQEPVPESVINHIQQCRQCHEQINRLKVVLSQNYSIEPAKRQASSAITTMLELHFSYIDKPVTCYTVRPFLAGLSDTALEIRIPTPITAHLDNCRECAEDFKTIKNLNLKRQQLYRLSQLLGKELSREPDKCSKIKGMVKSVASMDFGGVNAEAFKHLSKCPSCRNLLYLERQKICDSLAEQAQSPVSGCESVSATDVFDYVVPYGLDPANDKYPKFRESVTSHLRSCPACLAKMQELYHTIYHIAERAESKVVTIYRMDESTEARAGGESDDLYAGFPIRVEIASRGDNVDVEEPVATINFSTALKRKAQSLPKKALVKTGIAAAAVILVAVGLFFLAQPVKAVTIGQIYRAIEKAKNIHILKRVPGKTEPIEERWVSHPLNIYMSKTGNELVLSDIKNRVRKTKYTDTLVTETIQLTDAIIASVEIKMSGSLGLMPFYDISEIPEDAEWHRVEDEIQGATEGVEIYDLKWAEKQYGGSEIFKRWRVYANPETNLPQRVEGYQRSNADSEYILRSVMVVEYLDESEIWSVMKEASF